MDEQRQFQDKQYAFAAHIRDPDNHVAPDGIEDRRMAIYRELFFNNLYNLLGTFFPVLRKIHTDEQWHLMIREFMKKHRAQTPYFLELPDEFLDFLRHEYPPQENDYPFLTELAHYEYAELALSVSTDDNDLTNIDADGDLLTNVPVKSVLAWAFSYHYAVHKIAPNFLPSAADDQLTYLVIYRRSNDKVDFLKLNAVTAGLLEAVENNSDGLSGEALLRELAKTIHYTDVDALLKHGSDTLEEMRQLEILTGTRRAG